MQRMIRYELSDSNTRTFFVQMPAVDPVLKVLAIGVPGETTLQVNQHTAQHLVGLLEYFVRTGQLPTVDVGASHDTRGPGAPRGGAW